VQYLAAAFAELQTDMTEIVGNISGPSGLPFHSYAGFCVRSFFPGVPANDHAVLRTFEVSETPTYSDLTDEADSHCHTGHDKTVATVSCLAWRCELDIIAINAFSGGSALGRGGALAPPTVARPPNLAVLLTHCGQIDTQKN